MGKTKTTTRKADKPLRLEYRTPAEMAENPKNWRRHPDAQIAALGDVIADVGWAGACLFNEATGRLIDGHARRKVAQANGSKSIPVLVGNWTEEQEAKILATLDPLGAMAQADAVALDALLKGVAGGSAAVDAMLKELAAANPLPVVPGGGGDEFQVPDTEGDDFGDVRPKLGDVWVVGGRHRVACGDSTKAEDVGRCLAGAKASLIWTDPPYGVNHSGGTKDPREADYRSGDKLANDNLGEKELEGMLIAALGGVLCEPGATAYVAAPAEPLLLVFMRAMNASGLGYRGHVVWVKNSLVFGRSLYHYRHEPILYGWKAGPHYEDGNRTLDSVFVVDRQQANEEHPTMKPLALVQPMIEHSSPAGSIVYDPFLGSGTTLIAAHRLGRTCYGLEIEPKYVEVILRRCEAEGLSVELEK